MMEIIIRNRKRKREISMIPLIDVVLLLLIFFLMVGTLNPPEILPIDVPESDTGEERFIDDPAHILLTTEGEIYFNYTPVTEWSLAGAVRYRLKLFPGQPMILKADASLPAQRLIRAIRILYEAGVTDLSIATQQALSAPLPGKK